MIPPLAATIAQKLCETERAMLLDFAGLETGKVVPGAAMWTCHAGLVRLGLMSGGSHSVVTALGLSVAQRVFEGRAQ